MQNQAKAFRKKNIAVLPTFALVDKDFTLFEVDKQLRFRWFAFRELEAEPNDGMALALQGYGVMVYWHVETNAVCIYSQNKSFSNSEVSAMIEGRVRHDTEMRVEKNFGDCHGQSEVAFAFCHLPPGRVSNEQPRAARG